MAYQTFRVDISEFNLDLHGTEIAEAKLAVRRRLDECYRYGIRVLKVVYGTPDHFDCSIAKVVHQIVRVHERVDTTKLPLYVFDDVAPQKLDPELRLHLQHNPSPQPMDENTSFGPFNPKYEKQLGKRLRCKTPYMPLRQTYSLEWASRAIGRGCTPQTLAKIATEQKLCNDEGLLPWAALCIAAKSFYDSRLGIESRETRRPSLATRESSVEALVIPAVESPVDTARQLLWKARTHALSSRYEDAESELAALMQSEVIAKDQRLMEEALTELGAVYVSLGRPEAEGMLKKALNLMMERLGKGEHLRRVVTTLAEWYLTTGDYEVYLTFVKEHSYLRATTEALEQQRLGGILLHARVQCSAGHTQDSLESLKQLSAQKGDQVLSPDIDAFRFDLAALNSIREGELFLGRTRTQLCPGYLRCLPGRL